MSDFRNDPCFRFFAEIIQTLKSTNQYEKVLHLIVDRLMRMYRCQTCAIVLIDPKTEYLHIDHCQGLSLTFCNAFRRRIATAATGQLLWTGKPVVISDSSAQQALAAEIQLEHPFASCLCAQIAIDQRSLGYIHMDSAEKNVFRESDIPLLELFADISGLAIIKAKLFEENLRLERIDRETGLDKYPPFLEKLAVGIKRAQEFGESLCVMILDVDNFKDIVNTFGYDTSRRLLHEMATTVESTTRPVDAAGRYGFDEFILMLESNGLNEGIEIATKLRKLIEEQEFTEQKIHSTVSIGIAAYPQNGMTLDEVLVAAKNAIFQAQRRGRNNVFSYHHEWHENETT